MLLELVYFARSLISGLNYGAATLSFCHFLLNLQDQLKV